MILIECNDLFYRNHFKNIIEQCNLPFTINPNDLFFDTLVLECINNSFKVVFQNQTLTLKKPIQINHLFQNILDIVQNFKVFKNDLTYFPFKQTLLYNSKETVLRNTHNIIFKILLLHASKKNLDKKFLYSSIWPRDKEILMNKLDTHLTNLKQFLHNELDLNLKIISEKNLIKLLF